MKFIIFLVFFYFQTIHCIRNKFDLFSFFAKSDNVNMTELNTKESKTTIDAINQKSDFFFFTITIILFLFYSPDISLNTSRTKEIEKAQNERNNFQNELNKKLSENVFFDQFQFIYIQVVGRQ